MTSNHSQSLCYVFTGRTFTIADAKYIIHFFVNDY